MRISERPDFYDRFLPELRERTQKRLIMIEEAGMEEVGIAQFGIPGVMSGLYIEKVWRYSDEDFEDYMNWVLCLKKEKQSK